MEKDPTNLNLTLRYDSPKRAELPHVLKFSGGRSSAMMLLGLLQNGQLNRDRGDVVIFNNTSAEHPATYAFAKRCTEITEQDFGIPFFWIEFTTVEDASNGSWSRIPTFKLVNTLPNSDRNTNGYHCKGEVFEELVSHQAYLPGRQNRICTSHLKLHSTSRFLSEWFAAKESTKRMGHFHSESLITSESILAKHRSAQGKSDENELLRKRAYVRSSPIARESQLFDDFSNVGSKHLKGSKLAEYSLGDFAFMKGPGAVEYISLIGLRDDEPQRVARVKGRNKLGSDDPARRSVMMSDGEIVMTPLADAGIGKEDVLSFWREQRWQLRLPEDGELSNCVYCFMKGTKAIPRIRDKVESVDQRLPEELRSVPGTPSDIQWWVDLEKKYSRVAPKRSSTKNEIVRIGFWGTDSAESYQSLKELDAENTIALDGVNAIPCDCTD